MKRALLFAILILAAAFAGCTASEDDAPADVHTATARTIAPGATVAFPLVVEGVNASERGVNFSVVDDAGLDVELPQRGLRAGGNASAAYVRVTAPQDAEEGERVVTVRARGEAGPALLEARLPVTVEVPHESVGAGDVAMVEYTGRLASGAIFDSNVAAVVNSSLPKADMYTARDPAGLQPLPVQTGPGARVIRGFADAVEGLGVGHSVTVDLPPHLAYGNATIPMEEPRVTTVERTIESQRVFTGERQLFRGLVNDTSEEGDLVRVAPVGEYPAFVITRINDTHAELTMDAEVGERYTLHPAWPGSSEVVNVTNASVEFYVTPTSAIGETVTWFDHWSDATVVVAVTDEVVTLRHSPPVGTEYTSPSQQGQPLLHRVVALEDDIVVVERENPARLAGETLIFDITVISLQ